MIQDKLKLNDKKIDIMVIGTEAQLKKVNITNLVIGKSAVAPSQNPIRNLRPRPENEVYVLPTAQDLYTALVGSKIFSKLDLSHAYAQLGVDKERQEYLTINTHKCLYSYLKLPYGVKSTPKIFQAKMNQILHGVEKRVCKQDGISRGK